MDYRRGLNQSQYMLSGVKLASLEQDGGLDADFDHEVGVQMLNFAADIADLAEKYNRVKGK